MLIHYKCHNKIYEKFSGFKSYTVVPIAVKVSRLKNIYLYDLIVEMNFIILLIISLKLI